MQIIYKNREGLGEVNYRVAEGTGMRCEMFAVPVISRAGLWGGEA